MEVMYSAPLPVTDAIEPEARAIHAAGPLAWMAWDELDDECRAEYRERACKAASDKREQA